MEIIRLKMTLKLIFNKLIKLNLVLKIVKHFVWIRPSFVSVFVGFSTFCVGLLVCGACVVVRIGFSVVVCACDWAAVGEVLLLSTQHFMFDDGHLISSRISKQIIVASECTQTPGHSFTSAVLVIESSKPVKRREREGGEREEKRKR